MLKKILNCFIGINFLLTHIFDSSQNTRKASILNDAYIKISKLYMSNSLAKFDIHWLLTRSYIRVYHLKSIYQTLKDKHPAPHYLSDLE